MKMTTKKIISIFLAVLMFVSMMPASIFASSSAAPKVEIISFMRGSQEELRSSELLEARVSGYDGNVRELTYKWSTTLGTYLYVYNSHNMYYIRNTPGEVEVYNSKKLLPTPDMTDRYHANSFTGTGYAWAAVHSVSQYDKSQLVGVVTVEVYDKDGNLLCSDSHEGKLVDNKNTGFLYYDLEQDLDNVVIGLFEGDKRNVLDLLGESAVVHIVCIASTVMNGKITSGDEYIDLAKESDGNYYITAVKAGANTTAAGDALVDLTVQKSACKFHRGTSGNAETTVFVFKKPTTRTTTTTLTLGNIDLRCEYFINGVKGTTQADGTVIFTGLDPNTNYPVEVRAKFEDSHGNERYAYAFVYDTTKPVYKATVQTYLDDELTDIADIHGEEVTLYLHEDIEGAEYIALGKEGTGVYTAEVNNGIYFPWHIEAGDHYHKAKEFKLIIENANGQLDLHHYSVNYDANGGAFDGGDDTIKEIYPSTSSVKVSDIVPTRAGYTFAGWDYNGNVYNSGDEVTSRIASPITLIAKWEKMVNVTINVEIDHKVDGGFDENENRDELTVDFLEMKAGTGALVETGDKLNFSKENIITGYKYETVLAADNKTVLVTKYTAEGATYTGLSASSEFGVAVGKSGYDTEVEKIKDADGNWTINIKLAYNPDEFDIDFSVRMAEDVPAELYPDAVIVKLARWNGADWEIITPQRTTEHAVRPGVRVDIDPVTGEGSGSYPVWKYDANTKPYGYRAVVAGFIYKDSTIVVPTDRDHNRTDEKVIMVYTDGNYKATMGDVADGKKYSTSLNGAYYNNETDAQQGTLDAVITVEKYDVTFDAKGGTVNGKNKDVAEQKYRVPSFEDYQPTMNGHSFLGWYTANGEKATEGELLTEDITLYAKWDKTLTGTLIVDGYYTDESGTQHEVDSVDRATHALVELEEIFDGHTYDIAGQTVEIEWAEGEHTSIAVPYEFKGLDPDKTYRINVYLMNYEAFYQNSTTVINGNGDIHDDYNEFDFTAVYPEKALTTFVNTFLHFEPEEAQLNVIVDSSRIGAGFRYEDALVKYYSEENGVEDDYVLITQHKGENEGVHVKMNADGKTDGTYGDKVWKKNYNGNIYDYQASLVTLDGKDIAALPVDVIYGESVRWSPYKQDFTDTLKVEIHPKRYKIVYHWNDGTDKTEHDGMGHVWSYETPIEGIVLDEGETLDYRFKLERDGYKFCGWYADPECTGESIKVIPAEVAENINVYAKWEKIPEASLTIKHVVESTGDVLSTVITEEMEAGTVVEVSNIEKLDKMGYTYSKASHDSIIIDADSSKNVVTLYYTANSYKYQVNYLEKGTNKELAISKEASADFGGTIVETAVVVKGYNVAGETTQTIKLSEDVIKENDLIVINFYYIPTEYTYTVNYLEEGTNRPLASAKESKAAYGEEVTEQAIAIKNYILADESSKSIKIDIANNTINFYYTADKLGGGEHGDGIPDKYQKKVIFKVTNGTWEDGTTADKVVYLDLMKNGEYAVDGTASLTAPAGMVAAVGYKNGSWDSEIPTNVSGTETLTFTYSFVRSTTPVEPLGEVSYIVEYYKDDVLEETEIFKGKIGDDVTATIKDYEGYDYNEGKSVTSGKLVKITTDEDVVVLKVYYDKKADIGGGDTPTDPDTPDVPDTPVDPEDPTDPEVPGGEGEGEGNGSLDGNENYILFGKTDGIGWYNVSKDGGQTWEVVFGNSTYAVEKGTEIIVKVGDLMGDTFTFYVNGDKYYPDENGQLVITVNGYMLIGAVSVVPDIDFEVPDVDESLNWFQRIIKAIKDFFAKLFGKK